VAVRRNKTGKNQLNGGGRNQLQKGKGEPNDAVVEQNRVAVALETSICNIDL
jgi:hypothetical protein